MKRLILFLFLLPSFALGAGVVDGQPVNAATTNAAFIYKNGNDSTNYILSLLNSTDSTTTTNGALKVSGGIGIVKSVNIGGHLYCTDTTQSTSTSTGSIVTSGGLGIAKNIYAGGNIEGAGNIDATGNMTAAQITLGSPLTVSNGGIGITSGTNGGILAFTGTSTLVSSGLLTANQLIKGGGAGVAPSTLAAGSEYAPLVMGATVPGYAALNLAQSAAVTGTLPNANTTATNANTASTIVSRDGSGNFTATTITSALTGTASGNTTYTPTNHGVVISSATNAMSVTSVGTTGQFLKGVTGADPVWGSGSSSPLTTKGDLWGYSTVDTRVPVGTDTYILVADSSQTTGLRWAAPLTGSINIPNATDSIAYTPTFSAAWGTVTNVAVFYRRVGDYLEVTGTFTPGSTTGAQGLISIPATLAIDSAKLGTDSVQIVGQISTSQGNIAPAYPGSSNGPYALISKVGSTTTDIIFSNSTSSGSFINTNVDGYFASGFKTTFWFRVPIVGWTANTITSIIAGTAMKAPTIQTFTSGSGTYTAPTSPTPLYLKIKIVGGGGGGSGSGTSGASNGGTGVTSLFGSIATGGGGGGGSWASSGGPGGTGSIASPAYGTAIFGANGSGSGQMTGTLYIAGGPGGNSPYFSGGGASGAVTGAGLNGTTNTGGGGAGGGTNTGSSNNAGAGGGSGGFVEFIVPSPSATYSYTVGTGATGGGAGVLGNAGGNGADGYIEVTEYYQ